MKYVFKQTICCAASVLALASGTLLAQDDNSILPAYYGVRPWTGGDGQDQQSALLAGGTIPMGTFNFAQTKTGTNVTETIVGRSPFLPGKTNTNINVILIPIVITIGTTTFDSTAVETCGNGAGKGLTSTQLLAGSPLFDTLPWTLNGVNVGTTQFGDAFRRGEFWSLVGGSNYHTHLNLTTGPTVTISSATVGTNGIINGTGCGTLGIVSNAWFQNLLEGTIIPGLSGSGVGPTNFPIFVLRNVVQSGTTPPTIGNCCIIGYHGAYGSPVQTYSPTEYDTSGRFGVNLQDSSVLAHEILEWFDDPLGSNPAPGNWGAIGQQSGCQSNWEVGDPLSGTLQSAAGTVGANGVTYHLQELVYFSWFFNSNGTPSIGTGGKFSSNGTFTGPSKVCPPGGTN